MEAKIIYMKDDIGCMVMESSFDKIESLGKSIRIAIDEELYFPVISFKDVYAITTNAAMMLIKSIHHEYGEKYTFAESNEVVFAVLMNMNDLYRNGKGW